MNENQQRAAARRFADEWAGRGYEKGESQSFWLALLRNVLGVERPESVISFENQVQISSTGFIDTYIEPTRVLIEQKSLGKDLRKPIRQSDGTLLTPFQQAKRYAAELPYSRRPRWVVTCNFSSFLIYDMENPQGEPEEVLLENLEKDIYRLRFLTDTGDIHLKREMEVSIQAGEIVGLLYDKILAQYLHPDSPDTLRSLNILCVRLVFCLYAEDAGVFGRHGLFHDYLAQFPAERMRIALMQLFTTLNTPVSQRDPYLMQDEPLLASFPYVNGGLFAEAGVEIPSFNEEIKNLLLTRAGDDFDWSEISPTIFGAVFESTLNPETRRSGGMHYTSIENIHKVIDPLFLNNLRAELDAVMQIKQERQRNAALTKFQHKLAGLKFLDPACGSGNFLTETYLSLRRLENEVLLLLHGGQGFMGAIVNPIEVSIHQFYGIEINDFAVTVATTALWIAEAQMMAETERIVQMDLEFLPLKSYANITEDNALRINWEEVCPKEELDYIMGNPPFVGARMMEQGGSQKQDIEVLFGKIKDVQDLDYVSGWYMKAANYILGTKIRCALVSTNSITQGSQVPILWNEMKKFNVQIDFAYRTFRRDSESNSKAHVHCIIVGFSNLSAISKDKRIYDESGRPNKAKHINGYLVDGEDIYVEARNKPLCNVSKMCFGNQPRDGGYFVLSNEEKAELIRQEPSIAKWIKLYIGAEEFIKGKTRWCIWLKDSTPIDIKNSKILYARVAAVRDFRLSSKAKTTIGYAKVPHLFAQITQPDGMDYIIMPRVSSERRRYVPMGFANKETISSDAVQIIPNATLYELGVLTSNVHMAWMRAVCGRLEMRYRYSKDIVYNNFPWPETTEAQREKIAATAQAILDARALYPDCSLADLYDEVTMPPELRRAHQQNDRAVMEAYGFTVSSDFTESDCVARLLARYQALTKQKQ